MKRISGHSRMLIAVAMCLRTYLMQSACFCDQHQHLLIMNRAEY